jgi:hypothetical protein
MSIVWTVGMTVDRANRLIVEQALLYFKGNKTRTSESLGIDVRTLDNWIEKYKGADEVEKLRIEKQKVKNADIQRRVKGELAYDANGFAYYKPLNKPEIKESKPATTSENIELSKTKPDQTDPKPTPIMEVLASSKSVTAHDVKESSIKNLKRGRKKK